LTRFTHISNKVGNRDVMIREDGDCRYITTYSYDENDRLTGSSTSIEAATLEMQRKLDRKYAGRPRGWTRWAVLGFAGATLSAFWMPLFLPSSRRLGRRARRKQLFTACVATFLAPLMAVHPEAAHALTTEAIQAQVAITAGVALDCDDTITTTYAYDANGNQIGRTRTDSSGTHTDTYVFDYKNRLAQAATRIEGPPAFVRYTYDADGIRNRKVVDANTGTFFLTDKNRPYAQVIEERTDDVAHDLIVAYTYGDDLISQSRPDGSAGFDARYYHYDGHMSTRTLTDDNPLLGEVVVTDRYSYDAFGVGVHDEGSSENHYRYSGEQIDEIVECYYLRARLYAETLGRFISSDPASPRYGDPQTLHRYTYVHNSPVDNIDPNGLFQIADMLSQQGIESILLRVVNIYRTVKRAEDRIRTVIDIVKFTRILARVLSYITTGSITAMLRELEREIGLSIDSLGANGLLTGFRTMFAAIGDKWEDMMAALEDSKEEISMKTADAIKFRIPTYILWGKQRKLRLYLLSPTGPGRRKGLEGGAETWIPVGRRLGIGVARSGGRLFGLAVRKQGTTEIDYPVHIDYWDLRDGWRRGKFLLHYHVFNDREHHEIWPTE
jgi:RHS repeat-associated protein